MIRFYRTPRLTRYLYSSLTWTIQSSDSIFLTFDDGPDPEVTPWVLDQLNSVSAKATFFCLGRNIDQHPQLMQQIVAQGHQIGNHTYSHMKGWRSKDSSYCEDVSLCDEVMMEHNLKSDLFRPPYGRIKKSQIKKLRDKRIIMWSHLSWDFDDKLSINKSISQLKKAKPGSVLVFHDSQKAFNNLQVILPEILSHFQAKGFKFEALL
ncbi:polysaccharide deacetylase family protein [Ekhidna sp.]|uniref:polysaccharide deacetylase family protein n=1 Tax=Ekhidna sp. TaxID=2608089 RepID=UPI003CCB934F